MMKINQLQITIRDIAEDYSDDTDGEDTGSGGVVGFRGRLNVRPPYQRNFVYDEKERNAVIKSITGQFPLNVMYWADIGNGRYEMIDGQQRTISICQYVNSEFSVDGLAFHNLQDDQKEQILDYELMVFACSGTDSEKLDWFKTINLAGKRLTSQELRNAVYHGSWVSDAKRYFSRPNLGAGDIGRPYLNGSPNRQEFLEAGIKWFSGGRIEDYMSEHQHDPTAGELWRYFQSVVSWVRSTFPKVRSSMKGVDWGYLYNDHHSRQDLDPEILEKEVVRLHKDDDVTSNSGIYAYLLTGEEKHLSIRAFTPAMKETAYEKQDGICAVCRQKSELSRMHADHVDPWSKGGKTTEDNCRMLCEFCNRRKSDS